MRPFDASGQFRPGASQGETRKLAVRGAGFTLLSGGAGFGVQLISTVVLARLLTPGDYGLVAMVTTFNLLLTNFGLNGFTEAIQQREQINRRLVSNLFWINAGVGLLLTIAFAGAGSLLARFYGDPRVAHVTVAISPTIFLSSISVEHLALLKRAMRFSTVSFNDMVARVISLTVSIGLAWFHFGYWALVAGALATPLTTAIGAWLRCRWIPGWPRREAGTGSMVRYCLNVYGRFSFNYFARNTDNLLVGWRFGPSALGFYKKAYDLFLLPACQLTAPLTSVAVSALSRLDAKSEQYRRYFLRTIAIMAFVGMGIGADLTLVANDIIRLVLGPGWETAGRIFMFFGPGVGIMLIYNTHGWLHLSIGTAHRWFRWVIVEFAVTAGLFLVGLHWGPAGIAGAWTLSFWILTIPAFLYAGSPIGFRFSPVFAEIWRYILAGLAAGCAAAGVLRAMPLFDSVGGAAGAFVRIMADSALFAVLYLVAIIALHGGVAPLLQFKGLALEMMPWGKRSESVPAVTVGEAETVTS
ncbi:MAG: lipopolysaccharide biosynthesis protein [Terriglobales bacterium]